MPHFQAFPSSTNFTYKLPLDQPNQLYVLYLCPTQVRQIGGFNLAVYNPMPTMPLAYNLTLSKIGRCLHNCSDNGRCEGRCTAMWGEGSGHFCPCPCPPFNLLPPPAGPPFNLRPLLQL